MSLTCLDRPIDLETQLGSNDLFPNFNLVGGGEKVIGRIYLDVDGVINAWSWDGSKSAVWDDWNEATILGFPITYSPTVVDWLRNIPEDIEVVWLTTWLVNEHYKLIAEELELPKWKTPNLSLVNERYYQSSWRNQSSIDWKLPVLQSVHEKEPLPFMWLDDDLAQHTRAVDWLKTLRDNEPPVVWSDGIQRYNAIAPRPNNGLERHQLKMMDTWINRLRDGM